MAEARLEGENSTGTAFDGMVAVELPSANTQERELVARKSTEDAPAYSSAAALSESRHRRFLVAGFIVAVFWVAGVIAFSLGQSGLAGLLTMPVTGIASLVFVTVGPAIFVLLASVLITELARFRSTARYIGAMAARFADPARATREDARLMAEAVRTEITKVNGAVEGALARLGAMEEVLGHHGEAFAASEAKARARTDALINDLRREREAVADLAMVLDQKAADIAAAITEQSKMVVAAADIANAHAIDSTKTLKESAERLTGSACDAAQEAKTIAVKLDDASERLSSSTSSFDDARKALDVSTGELEQIRVRTRDSFASSRDDARALVELTRQSVEQIEGVARTGADVITGTFESALHSAHANVQALQSETQAAAKRNIHQSEELKNAAIEARSALDAYAEVIAKRLEQANEASFSAASWADKTFERLEKATVRLEEKLAALPETADAQARDLQEKLCKGLAGLNAAARSAADEAEEIDAAFQARIRQNYELLSDFMLRMGSAADQRGGALEVPSPFAGLAQTVQNPIAPPTAPKTPEPVLTLREEAVPEQKESSQNTSEKPVKNESTWRWKDVLSGMDRSKQQPQEKAPAAASSPALSPEKSPPAHFVPEASADALDRLVTLFRIHDIDPPALFTSQTFRGLSHARLVGGQKAMTDIVRLEAGAQVRALADAFADDASLCEVAQGFADELRAKLDEAAKMQNRVHLETHLRTSDGPAYLLIEAALS